MFVLHWYMCLLVFRVPNGICEFKPANLAKLLSVWWYFAHCLIFNFCQTIFCFCRFELLVPGCLGCKYDGCCGLCMDLIFFGEQNIRFTKWLFDQFHAEIVFGAKWGWACASISDLPSDTKCCNWIHSGKCFICIFCKQIHIVKTICGSQYGIDRWMDGWMDRSIDR